MPRTNGVRVDADKIIAAVLGHEVFEVVSPSAGAKAIPRNLTATQFGRCIGHFGLERSDKIGPDLRGKSFFKVLSAKRKRDRQK